MLIQEARMRFLKSMGYTELAIEGRGIVLADEVGAQIVRRDLIWKAV